MSDHNKTIAYIFICMTALNIVMCTVGYVIDSRMCEIIKILQEMK